MILTTSPSKCVLVLKILVLAPYSQYAQGMETVLDLLHPWELYKQNTLVTSLHTEHTMEDFTHSQLVGLNNRRNNAESTVDNK